MSNDEELSNAKTDLYGSFKHLTTRQRELLNCWSFRGRELLARIINPTHPLHFKKDELETIEKFSSGITQDEANYLVDNYSEEIVTAVTTYSDFKHRIK